MKTTIVYDNTTERSDLKADWGWSCFVESSERNILFDTGGNGRILMYNLSVLEINPETVDDIVISHPDFDHIGGLSAILNSNSKAKVHVPFSFRGIRYPNLVTYYDKPTKIYNNIFLTGELNGREQGMAIKTEDGLTLIIGCGHPGVRPMIESVSEFGEVQTIIGGLHDFDDFSTLDGIDCICSTHCTKKKAEIERLYPEKYIAGGVGKVIESVRIEKW